MKITVSVTNDLVTDQRVHKVSESLHNAGYQVKLVGRKFKNSKPIKRNYPTHRMRLLFNRSFFFYAEYNIRLFFYLLFDKADIFLSNDTDSLPANYLASRIRRKPLVFDAHEMFPEVPEVVNRKQVKKVWTSIEDWIFPKLTHCYTVCQSIADIYNQKYGINMQVIRNIPFAKQNTQAIPSNIFHKKEKKIILYQGAVNVGRGIEQVMAAMPYLDEFDFYVIGDGDMLAELKEKAKQSNLADRVHFLGRIPFEELPAYTTHADIGINILENRGLNYYYALPNRIFDYIRADVPIIASDFPEIRRIVSHYKIGKLIDNYEPKHLASVICLLIAEEKDKEAFRKANEELTWEKESALLLEIINNAAKEGG